MCYFDTKKKQHKINPSEMSGLYNVNFRVLISFETWDISVSLLISLHSGSQNSKWELKGNSRQESVSGV